MNNIIKKSIYVSMLGLFALFTSCEERQEELTELMTERVFSATGVEARIVNKTQVVLSWTKNQEAESYTVEVFENDSLTFSGTPMMVIDGITNSDIPYTITSGLVGQTQYSARIKTISKNDKDDSKWKGIVFKTASEQILQEVDGALVTGLTAVIKWIPGETATHTITSDGVNEIRQDVTAAEIEAGQMTITGLSEETYYTVRLMKDDKVRGSGSFETLLDLTAEGTIVVASGEDLLAAIQGAPSGARIVINPTNAGDAFLTGGVTIELDKAISIRGYQQSKMPVLHAMFRAVGPNASLFVRSVELNGLSEAAYRDHLVQLFVSDIETGPFIFKDCIITNYNKSILAGASNIVTAVKEFRIENCKVSNILTNSADCIDVRAGVVEKLNLINSTFFNCAPARDFIRLDDASAGFTGKTSVVNVNRCTFSAVSNNATKRILYIRYGGSAAPLNNTTFNNNVIANTAGYYTNQPATVFTMSKNNYFNAPGFTVNETVNAQVDVVGNFTQLNPGFVDEANANLTITNQTLLDNAVGANIKW
ncbi:MAG: DUF4957 domain-containing protein [Paludibacteraceae bacterium]|nr:DUF4957 domain-containing protein [Paludibacteraceae bacterium]